jgi:hypothetical protein
VAALSAQKEGRLTGGLEGNSGKDTSHDRDGEIIADDSECGEAEPRTVPSNLSSCCCDVTGRRRPPLNQLVTLGLRPRLTSCQSCWSKRGEPKTCSRGAGATLAA